MDLTSKKYNVPKSTLRRYPVYLKVLRKLQNEGVERVLSRELAEELDFLATTIRRDFSFIGSLGKQGYGYDVNHMIDVFEELLGMKYGEKIVIIGVGNLGKALLNYNRWGQVVGEIVCGFDQDPAKIGEVNGIQVYPMEELAQRLPKECRVAIITVDKNPQEVVDVLMENGIIGIVDFSHEHIQVKKGVILKQVDVVAAIQELIFQANNIE